MKKAISFTLASILALSAIPASVFASQTDIKYDVNLDGAVTKDDARAMDSYLGRDVNYELSEEILANIEENGDFNNDGSITYDDVHCLYYHLFDTGVVPTDFNLDGKFTAADADVLLTYYTERQLEDEENPEVDLLHNEEIRKFIAENGDFCVDELDSVTSFEAAILLIYFYKDKTVGDVTLDGNIDALDASSVLTYYSEYQTGSLDKQFNENDANVKNLGDYNGDGNVNALDASEILTYYANAQTALAE
ncbi:MAG: hypothetical protein IJX77_09140 [Ruminococcus sp.]|nr:hypothetical protein [Ruminococcus sp.]